MKRILLTAATAALLSTSTAFACVRDGSGNPVLDGNGAPVKSGSGGCSAAIDASVLFAFNSAVLTAEGMAILDGIDGESVSTVTGYASTDGDDMYNQWLSEARAKAVADYLGGSATAVGAGETSDFGASAADNRVVTLS